MKTITLTQSELDILSAFINKGIKHSMKSFDALKTKGPNYADITAHILRRIDKYKALLQRLQQAPTMGKPFYNSFDEYVVDYPEAEHFRRWLLGLDKVNQPTRQPIILKGDKKFNCLPGHYLWAHAFCWEGEYFVIIHDHDDLACKKKCKDEIDAQELLEALKNQTPFSLEGLVEVLGFYWD